MGQKISMEEAFPTFQRRCTELFDEGMLLRAQVHILEQRLAAALEENEKLRAQLPQPEEPAYPMTAQDAS